ncbi:MAG: glycosyltransferase involved in cell wall biosynthesis [Myxococcota bacterium]|jgi:glycosyltransferase involved in cell wall biosynthesis
MSVEISVVVPLFNEEANLPVLVARLTAALADESYELRLVDDGSSDTTAAILARLAVEDARIKPVYLARNFGHQPAVTAGLDHAEGTAIIVMDGDMQDPPEVLPDLIAKWREGFEVVYAVRTLRKEGPLLRLAYFAFYRILDRVADTHIPLDSGDFCLMDRMVVDALASLPERQRFVRGLRSWVGFRQTGVTYERAARQAGDSKYSIGGLTRLAVEGLVSFSGQPLRAATVLGGVAAVLSLVLLVWVLWDSLSSGRAPEGWASMVTIVLFMSGVQLVSLGVLGEYIRIIFLESKARPTYIVRPPRSQK